ncbi:hypothetical protein NDU88_001314 [Pleurodeles waltl]|uniref:Uncharacterized protein n=1 Tax=Pleurodeles waltl TaxID=8319 RepID=A0AAV7WHZ7_PLEWA|nr:hypothetical protein NDU88_001314 [Pleurodeles waltl]
MKDRVKVVYVQAAVFSLEPNPRWALPEETALTKSRRDTVQKKKADQEEATHLNPRSTSEKIDVKDHASRSPGEKNRSIARARITTPEGWERDQEKPTPLRTP